MPRIHRRHPYARAATAGAVLALNAFLGACQTQSMGGALEGIGFRQERFQEIAAMQTYRACVDDAVKLDTEARAQGHPGGYIASARLIEKCEAELGPEAVTVAQEERMRAYALSVLNYLKAGDVRSSRANLETFKRTFAGYDLYLANGASFTDTMELLTGGKSVPNPYEVSLLNVNRDVKAELQRVRFWKHN